MIATAANVQFAMEELTKTFTEETGIPAEIVLGSSGKLTAQIKEGAPFDVFVSANMKYPEELHRSGLATAAPKVYANGKLILWMLQEEGEPGFEKLTNAAVMHIAIANPKNAPYGIAAQEALQYLGFYEEVKDKLVYGESISQTNQFILSGTAAAGFTAKSVVLSPELKGKGKWIEVPQESYAPIQQGVVILKKEGKSMAEAEKFYTFLFSDKARSILQSYGYSIN
ncbi:molybdate ABC transporter substrate-binding protein [Pontibacter silvestris]|uniref:Molybdate ABC transporter substrate-binding protein n=2 Tax=Pontibacter silvestris TaxID=2305183 RepID=A0ABW4WWM9_9BACT